MACLDHATRVGDHTRVVTFTAALVGLLRQDGPWADAFTRHGTAVASALALGDHLARADALHDLGIARYQTGDYRGAAKALEEALGNRDLGNRLGQANTLTHLGAVRRQTGDYPGAAETLEAALAICRELGDRGGEAEGLNEAGTLYRACGDLNRAATCHQQALDLARAIDSPWAEACALAGLGR